MGGNNKYQSTIGQNHSRRLGGIITAGACVPIILQSRLQKVKALDCFWHLPSIRDIRDKVWMINIKEKSKIKFG